jgi:OOP family OmpA-OmpF porin
MRHVARWGFAALVALVPASALALSGCKAEAEARMGTGTPPPPPPPPPAPADTDGDGIADTTDKCIDKKEDGAAPDPNDGCPTDDPDKDGIAGAADKCPDQPENKNGYQDNDGCPDERPVVEVSEREIRIRDRILFETNSAAIDHKSDELIGKIAAVFKEHPEINFVEIAGHTDDRGSDALNKTLSQQRAASVMAELVKDGVEKTRLRPVGYGSFCPRDRGDSDDAADRNRRVQFHILVRDGKETGVKWGGCTAAEGKGMKPATLPAVKPMPKGKKLGPPRPRRVVPGGGGE